MKVLIQSIPNQTNTGAFNPILHEGPVEQKYLIGVIGLIQCFNHKLG